MSSFIRIPSSARATGPTGILQSIIRLCLLAVGVIVGGFLLISTAAFAVVVILALLVIGAIAFVYFWVRGRFFGKPFGGQAFADMRAQAKAQAEFGAKAQNDFADNFFTKPANDDDGDILDAHQTPDGWSVDQ